jgi:hypothetical protein
VFAGTCRRLVSGATFSHRVGEAVYDPGMTAADKDTERTATPSAKTIATAKAFVDEHGGAARAVVENLGRAGARIVLIGEDGRFGDLLVRDVAAGAALVAAVDGLSSHEWDGATTAALQIGAKHRRKMAGPRAR